MKTKTALLKFLFVLPLSFLFAACGGGSSSGSSTAVAGYYIYGQSCYASGTVTQTAYTNCQTGTYYRWTGSICTDQVGNNVGVQYCNNNQTLTGYGTNSIGGVYGNGYGYGNTGGIYGNTGGIYGSIGTSGYGGGYGSPTCIGQVYIQGYGYGNCGPQNNYCIGYVAQTQFGMVACH